MLIKFNGGPQHNKYWEMKDPSNSIFVQFAEPPQWSAYEDPIELYNKRITKKGEYFLSHNRLKNGTRIYQWIGWIT